MITFLGEKLSLQKNKQMNGLLIFTLFVCIVCLALLIHLYRKFDKQKAMALSKEALHYVDDSVKSAEEIGKFLKERAEICNISFSSNIISPADVNDIYRGRAAGVVALIRMAHRLGYELVVRECIEPSGEDLNAGIESDEEKRKRFIDDKVKEILGEK
ncbi:hypothetical protein [Phocaeicola plebeius]|uniref:hypothetical protein n=1 Tax=Phocaeicola plebeius TaxID=310297 RepID=UPI0029421683|nr:hypothetical protein [Phocaeicola plebeius]